MVYWIVVDNRDGLLKARHSGRRWPVGIEPSTVVELEPRMTSSSQESSASTHNESLALLPEHSELESAAAAESTSWWRCVGVLLLLSQFCVTDNPAKTALVRTV